MTYSDGNHATINALIDGLATVTNTYDPAELTVSKTVVGPGPAGPYSFAAACTLTSNTGDPITVPLAAGDAAFRLSAGERRVITVPSGAACLVRETNPAAGDTVSYDGQPTTPTITVDAATTLAVVNTFAAPGGGSGAPGGSAGAGGSGGSGSTGGAGASGASGSAEAAGSGQSLAATGENLERPTVISLVLVLAGLCLSLAGRRRRG